MFLRARPRHAALVFACALSAGAWGLARAAAPRGDKKPEPAVTADDVKWIDELARARWNEDETSKIKPSSPATDGEFVRRAYLDLVGHVPPADKAREYIASNDKEKKARLIESLLASEDYAKYWANVWSNLLIGRRPERMIDKASMLKYLRDSLAENKPWNTMVYELVTASGASRPNKMDVPFNGATNFMLAHLGDRTMPNVPATSFTTRLFLGVQVQCTQCHDHPFNERKQDSFWGINAFFHQMQKQDFNDTSDTGQRIFLFSELKDKPLGPDDDLFVRYDKRNGLVEVTPPRWLDGTKIADVSAELNLRQRLADFITDKDNPYFAQAIVNRMWAHFLGRGIVHPLDDLGEHNTPSNPELLERLAKHFVESNYDLKRLASWITLSMPYALSSKVSATNKEDESLFSHFPLKQMSPEQFFDSLMIASRADRVGAKSPEEVYKLKEALLAQFTTVFGNDEDREADSFNGTIPQALLLMNGDLMAKAISKQPGSYLRESVDEILNAKKAKKKLRDPDAALLDDLYVAAFSRYPTKLEQQTAMKLVRATLAQSKEKDPIDAYQDIFWALLNSSEFVLNH